ncbi:hypothetical protein AMTRI_Chr04g180750 [Amborella trichopoda]
MKKFNLSSPGFQSTQNQLAILDFSKNNIVGNMPLLVARKHERRSINSHNCDLMSHINDFKGLRAWDLSSNNISRNLLSIFSNNLTILNFSNNKITGELSPNLTRGNELMTLAIQTFQITQFGKSLRLDNNGTIPRNLLLYSPSLTVLNLANDEITGPMPIELFGLLKLEVLILRGNFFDHIPLKLCQVKSLAVLDFSQNNLEGPLPPCFNNFSAWTNASSIGSISSRYEPFLTFSTKLASRDRIGYKLHTISQEKVEFTKGNTYSYLGDALKYMTALLDLSTLYLSYNALSGKIPSQLTRLTHLSMFSVANNNLSGEILDTTQFCTFNKSYFSGNPKLNTQGKRCSTTLSSNVPSVPRHNDGEDEDEDEGEEEMTPAFYAFIAGL